jgi:tyrosine-specific transport protein
MIGLPVATAPGGFAATVLAFAVVWVIMMLTAFCMLEVSLWYPGESNLITMAHRTLGPFAGKMAWLVYLCFMYSVMAAYTAGGGVLSTEAINHVSAVGLDVTSGTISFVAFFAVMVFLGTAVVDHLNRWLMIGLMVAYVTLVFSVSPYVEAATLKEGQAHYLLPAVPLMVTAFGFHLLIPSLTTYFQHAVKPLRWAILIGGMIPLLVYLTWEILILGTIPLEGHGGLLAIAQQGDAVTGVTLALNALLENDSLSIIARSFTFLALVSSFIGVALGLFDFLADGLGWSKTPGRRVMLAVLTFGPPLLFAQLYPAGFLLALSYAGVFGAILLVLYPALMVLAGRSTAPNGAYQLFARPWLVWVCVGFGVAVVVLQVLAQTHMLPVMSATT